MRRSRRFLLDPWSLAGPYLRSEERLSAWALPGALVAISLAQVGLGLLISFSQSIFYTALQQKDPGGFFRGLFWFTPRAGRLPMPPFVLLAAINLGAYALATFGQSWLQIRWQRWCHGAAGGPLARRARAPAAGADRATGRAGGGQPGVSASRRTSATSGARRSACRSGC